MTEDTFTQKMDIISIRDWAALIDAADYFVGVDSVGQHMARSVGKPGTVIYGSTFPINTSYPDYFQIWEKPGVKKYAPLRLSELESSLANRINEGLMDLTEKEIKEIFDKIVSDIEKKK
jgi:ADP-heptose:LPS heptosyltransferase